MSETFYSSIYNFFDYSKLGFNEHLCKEFLYLPIFFSFLIATPSTLMCLRPACNEGVARVNLDVTNFATLVRHSFFPFFLKNMLEKCAKLAKFARTANLCAFPHVRA